MAAVTVKSGMYHPNGVEKGNRIKTKRIVSRDL